jgi:hypothetical protein
MPPGWPHRWPTDAVADPPANDNDAPPMLYVQQRTAIDAVAAADATTSTGHGCGFSGVSGMRGRDRRFGAGLPVAAGVHAAALGESSDWPVPALGRATPWRNPATRRWLADQSRPAPPHQAGRLFPRHSGQP